MVKSLHMNGISATSILPFTLGGTHAVLHLVQEIHFYFLRATFRVFKLERKLFGREDLKFLESVFQKLLLNFTW